LRAGIPPTRTVGEPGAHGAVVTGIQGMGVNTPWAAVVADATVGFEIAWHMPKGMMFTNGFVVHDISYWHGCLDPVQRKYHQSSGANPKLHLSIAPPHTF